jgi:preprotein translocase subunit SecY
MKFTFTFQITKITVTIRDIGSAFFRAGWACSGVRQGRDITNIILRNIVLSHVFITYPKYLTSG